MVAVAQLIPKDPKEQASVLAVLREHPELRAFIQQASAQIENLFPEATIELDTVRYDDWDPPIRMTYHAHAPFEEFMAKTNELISWLGANKDYDWDLIIVLPQWHGPENAS